MTLQPGPVIEVNAAVALAMVEGPAAGLDWIERLEADGRIDCYPMLHAARAELLGRLGRDSDAVVSYNAALSCTRNGAGRRWQ